MLTTVSWSACHGFQAAASSFCAGEMPLYLAVTLQGAVKISCARQDPNARNCHGYRKFVKRSVLENPQNGYLLNDTVVIRYTIELVVSSGGALSGHKAAAQLTPRMHPIPVSLNAYCDTVLAFNLAGDVSMRYMHV